MIYVDHLTKSFGDHLVLDDISEHIAPGEKVVVIGPSGSGKSTFLRCLNLLETPTSGTITFGGTEITDPKVKIDEVRRQFKSDPGILAGTSRPDYKNCVGISTKAALREMLFPGILAAAAPIVMGVLLGTDALGGMIAGALVSGVLLAIFMSNSGGAWDNAKKYIESGHHGGKGSEAHHAAVVGDTVGDPFKDTSGPSINILIKLMTVVSLVFAPLFLKIGSLF